MPSPPPRRPSMLAAEKFRAAGRPLGSMPEPRPSATAGEPPVNIGRAFSSARTSARPTPRAVPGTRATSTVTRERRDSVLVTSVVIAFVILTVGVAGVKLRQSMRVDSSRSAVTGTLTTVYEQQSAFRILNQRFATWPELRARGMRIPEEQRVIRSNASRSHWFMQVRDTGTGVTCSRTGELSDDGPFDRTPSCTLTP